MEFSWNLSFFRLFPFPFYVSQNVQCITTYKFTKGTQFTYIVRSISFNVFYHDRSEPIATLRTMRSLIPLHVLRHYLTASNDGKSTNMFLEKSHVKYSMYR